MSDPLDLIRRLGREEKKLLEQELVAPHFPGDSRVRVGVLGLVYEFRIDPRPAVGLGVFRPASPSHARFVRAAEPEQAEAYLGCFPIVRAVSAVRDDKGTWHALPVDPAAAAKARFAGMVPLVELEGYARDRVGGPFESVEGAYDGARVWVRNLDSKADLDKQEALRACLLALDRAGAERVKGLTAADREAAAAAFRAREESQRVLLDVHVRRALAARGGTLRSLRELVDGRVEVVWTSRGGAEYRSMLRSVDLSVVSAGICLSAEDQKFDLSSLVGVVHEGEDQGAIVEMDIEEARRHYPEA